MKNQMSASEKITIETDLFQSVGRMWPGERNAISPLPDYMVEPLGKKVIQSLQKRNFLTGEGRFAPEVTPYLNSFLYPDHSCEISIVENGTTSSYSFFFDQKENSKVFLKNINQIISIVRNRGSEEVLEKISELVPEQKPLEFEKEISLPLNCVWVFAAILDLFIQKHARKQQKAVKAKGQNEEVITQTKIKSALSHYTDSQEWLLLSLVSIITEGVSDNENDLDYAIHFLEEENILTKTEQGYRLSEEFNKIVNLFPRRYPLFYLQTSGIINSQHIEIQKSVCLSLMNAVFMIAFRENEEYVHFKLLNSKVFISAISRIIDQPEQIFPVFGLDIEASSAATCQICGQVQSIENQYCINCNVYLHDINLEGGFPYIKENVQVSNKPNLLRKIKKSNHIVDGTQTEENITRKKRLPLWLILLFILVFTTILCFTFTSINPITIRIK